MASTHQRGDRESMLGVCSCCSVLSCLVVLVVFWVLSIVQVLASVLFVLLLYQMVSGQCVMVVPCAAVCGLFVCNSLESSHNHISSLVLGRSCMIADAACLSFSSGWCIFQSHRRF